MRKALGCLCLAALTTSCNGGTTVSPATANAPVVQADGRVHSAPGSRRVTIAELSVPVQPFALAVDVNGAVYFAAVYTGGLYRYFGGTLVQTQTWSDPACTPTPIYPDPECFISLAGASAIDALGIPSPIWASPYILSIGFGPEFDLLLKGGSGGTATRQPLKEDGVGNVVSIITAHNGAVWTSGISSLPFIGPCRAPIGDPATVPFDASSGALVLTNGPRKHVWARSCRLMDRPFRERRSSNTPVPVPSSIPIRCPAAPKSAVSATAMGRLLVV